MSLQNGHLQELEQLLNALCDEHISREQLLRLEILVLQDRAARQLYLQYVDLHGMLHWDTAQCDDPQLREAAERPVVSAAARILDFAPRPELAPVSSGWLAVRHRLGLSIAAVVALLAIAVWFAVPRPKVSGPADAAVARNNHPAPNDAIAENQDLDRQPAVRGPSLPVAVSPADGQARHQVDPLIARQAPVRSSDQPEPVEAPQPEGAVALGAMASSPVGLIDRHIRAGWDAADLEPSPRAEDAEWLRRIYLDLAGHIPPVDVAEQFLADRTSDKRSRMVEQLLDSTNYVRNWSTVWGNLLVGRTTERNIDRAALQRFLRNAFAANRPWKDVVYDLVSAEGDASQNGATNFLLAHLNNEAVPATAITARLFMGMQVQCTQCHDHKLNDWKQNQFWELNCFFQQTEVATAKRRDPKSGKMVDSLQLVSKPVGGPIFFESRQHIMRAAYPKFAGTPVSPEPQVNRRSELARLMTSGESSLVARSMVNRMWEHFLGAGFTSPVDDMGPHNPASHPQLLDELTREFVRSGYDVKQLMRWICNSEPYQLSSRVGEANSFDNPASGETPLFSRVYIKSMTAEQMYDSILVASHAQSAGVSDWAQAERQRQQWLQPFVTSYGTEENDEASQLDGSLPQALLLMNGELTEKAVSIERGTFLSELAASDASETDKIRRVFLSALSRYPTPKELTALRGIFRQQILRSPSGNNRQLATAEGLKDLFWASLNSSEFVLIY